MALIAEEIPRVDLREVEHAGAGAAKRQAFDTAFAEALQHFGFVRVAGHGLPPRLIQSVYGAFEAFFALGDEVKLATAGTAGGQRGFTSFGIEHARDQATPDLKEFFHVGRELPAGHAYASVYPANVWPREIPRLREHSLALFDHLDVCAKRLLESLERHYALEGGSLSGMLCDGNSILRGLHYPPVAETASGRPRIRAAAHEDINLITLLCEATDSGLEIRSRGGEWLAVPALPGEIVVDAGDMLSRVTNEVIPSTTHRVVVPEHGSSRDRYSLPFFAHPRPDCDLSVLQNFVSPDRPARFEATTAGAFLEERLREIGLVE